MDLEDRLELIDRLRGGSNFPFPDQPGVGPNDDISRWKYQQVLPELHQFLPFVSGGLHLHQMWPTTLQAWFDVAANESLEALATEGAHIQEFAWRGAHLGESLQAMLGLDVAALTKETSWSPRHWLNHLRRDIKTHQQHGNQGLVGRHAA